MPRLSLAAVAAAATVVLVAAATGIDAARAQENPARPPRVLFIAIDAVPFATMAESAADERNGFLRSLRGPVPLISTFPSTTSLALAAILQPIGVSGSPRLRGEALRLGLEPRQRRRALRLRAVPLALVLRLEGRDPVPQGDVRGPADQGGAPGHPRIAATRSSPPTDRSSSSTTTPPTRPAISRAPTACCRSSPSSTTGSPTRAVTIPTIRSGPSSSPTMGWMAARRSRIPASRSRARCVRAAFGCGPASRTPATS